MREHLIQIARMAALCAILGVCLYLAIAALAGSVAPDRLALWLGLALSSSHILLFSPLFAEGWRTGSLPSKSGAVLKGDHPVWFAGMMAVYGTSVVAAAALAVYCGARLLSP